MNELPFTEEQIQWLKENLSIELESDTGYRYSDSTCLRVSLQLKGETISYASVSM